MLSPERSGTMDKSILRDKSMLDRFIQADPASIDAAWHLHRKQYLSFNFVPLQQLSF